MTGRNKQDLKRTMKQKYTWDESTPEGIASALEILKEYVPALRGGRSRRKSPKLIYRRRKKSCACGAEKRENGDVVISYSGMNQALRMTGNVLAGIFPGKEEACPFTLFGIMLDCSRNAVMRVERLKEYLARLSLFGYNAVMLYTEDTYCVREYPFFGYMRGRYSPEEIRETDAFCRSLGMELIPCIQTLGHLSAALRWNEYGNVRDTGDVLLAESEDTYRFIEAMLLAWKDNVKSRRIHIGCDETHSLGRGRYYDLHGDVPHADIFNRHLARVMKLCRKHGFRPMIWSDMYYRLAGSDHQYYNPDRKIDEHVRQMIPKGLELVYWDYYHDDAEFYGKMIESHRALAGEPLMASGVWTWNKFWYDREITEGRVSACIDACRKTGLRELLFTLWGDDGGFCDYGSSLAGLAYASEYAFTGTVSEDALNRKFHALIDGASYSDVLAASDMELTDRPTGTDGPERILWDDPVMMMLIGGHKLFEPEWLGKHLSLYRSVSDRLARAKKQGAAGDLQHARNLSEALIAKLLLAEAVLDAYFSGKHSRRNLQAALPLLEDYERKFNTFVDSFRAMWFRNNKPFGFETMQIRFGGQSARLKELRTRLEEYIAGKADSIPEFDELKTVGKAPWICNYTQISHATVLI